MKVEALTYTVFNLLRTSNGDTFFIRLYIFLYNPLHFHRPLQTLTNDQNPHRGGKWHYLHITDGRCHAEQLGNASKTTEEVLLVPRGVYPCPQIPVHITPLQLHTRQVSSSDKKGQSYLSVVMNNNLLWMLTAFTLRSRRFH